MIKEQKTKDLKMRDLFDKEFQQEMDDFFDYIDHEVLGKPKTDDVPVITGDRDTDALLEDERRNQEDVVELVHEVDGVVVCEPVEDVLKREAK
tara:strand:- start:2254 stop:2532 length:279 start_codon:yes stop_codon:yes gene_type:complete